VFETHGPWGANIVTDAITANGHTFTTFTPGQLSGFPFGDYRVVVLNWDDTFLVDFASDYSAAIPALEAYVNAGGVVWVQGAIQGVPGDNYPMPFGGQGNGADFGDSDPIVDPANPMVAGAPNPLEATLRVTWRSRACRVRSTLLSSTGLTSKRYSTSCDRVADRAEVRLRRLHAYLHAK
jgi:hypothetical protein